MKRLSLLLALTLMACGGSGDGTTPLPKPPAKPDPYVTVRVRDMLDTTVTPGRSAWHLYAILTSPEVGQNGVSGQGALTFDDVRFNHNVHCVSVGADSVGQRFLALLALADTTQPSSSQASADVIVDAWIAGNHTLPSGWMAIASIARDAWDSDQYRAGHGLVRTDPIKWGWDWTASGTATLYERSATDNDFCNTM